MRVLTEIESAEISGGETDTKTVVVIAASYAIGGVIFGTAVLMGYLANKSNC